MLEEADLVGKCCSGVKSGEAREGASLVWVEEAAGPGEEGEAGGGDQFYNCSKGFYKEDDPEGGRCVVGGFPRLV